MGSNCSLIPQTHITVQTLSLDPPASSRLVSPESSSIMVHSFFVSFNADLRAWRPKVALWTLLLKTWTHQGLFPSLQSSRQLLYLLMSILEQGLVLQVVKETSALLQQRTQKAPLLLLFIVLQNLLLSSAPAVLVPLATLLRTS